MSNQYPIAFCHGLFGWGNKALRIDYWGLASEVDSCGLPVFEASVGPVSSFHDRACELAAQIIVFGVFSQPALIGKQKEFYKSLYKRLAKL